MSETRSADGGSAVNTALIDVYAHFLTPDYVAAAREAGHIRHDGMPVWRSGMCGGTWS
jgi:hypothetical protein